MASTFPDDIDPSETHEWLEALESVLRTQGQERVRFLLERMVERARSADAHLSFITTTAYLNTIPVSCEQKFPGNYELEHRICSINRWNAMAMVLRAGKQELELGGHIASFQSAATLYEVGFNHFWRASNDQQEGDLIYIQGHSAPGIYARAYLEGRLTEGQLDHFRQEVDGRGLSSYPHPWLMPDFWQFPTVSMGLGPLMAIYQARFLKYLESRGQVPSNGRKVWCFCGDGEMDEPESLGAISLAVREGLDNLIFVINCNLQRLDGPVRGNGKIIQELEGDFCGSGWNVIKVVWGGRWDSLLARDSKGLLKKRMHECVDGDYQTFKSKNGSYVREHFFGAYPELRAMVANMSDDDIWSLNRGGHDFHKVYAAYYEATHNANGRPTVILAKTIKGYGMGVSGEAQNIAHQAKKMDLESIRNFRDRFAIPISDDQLAQVPYYKPAELSPEMQYMRARRAALGGYLPARKPLIKSLTVPELGVFEAHLKGSGEREFSTTMAFVRMLGTLLKDKHIGQQIVPIVPDESRTFGMEGMFRQYGIWSAVGQNYEPQDQGQLMFYKESRDGQILQEGINEPGAMSSWIAAATSYANHRIPMIPFYIYYSMFGFQRVGDLAWAAADLRARGFLLGGTAGRTTLNGEGLQHEDGHSHIQAGLIPNCISYDPAFAYELAVILQHGMQQMFVDQEDVYYYITLMNENYAHPAMPPGVEEGILKGMYLFRDGGKADIKVQLMGSGAILREVIFAADLLLSEFNIAADIWSMTSFNQLRREGIEATRWSMLHPSEPARLPYVSSQLRGRTGPIVAATDYLRNYADQIREYISTEYVVLGTDGFGRSDSRQKLRQFFEVDRYYIVVAALFALSRDAKISARQISAAIARYHINPDKLPSWKV